MGAANINNKLFYNGKDFYYFQKRRVENQENFTLVINYCFFVGCMCFGFSTYEVTSFFKEASKGSPKNSPWNLNSVHPT